mmetsp:Transcript_43217/g.74882  ORF Transcript_43217/g.74882 Transcript_43217/m.74882 type:complete len:208 (-) Transcript_43217:106-729(-)
MISAAWANISASASFTSSSWPSALVLLSSSCSLLLSSSCSSSSTTCSSSSSSSVTCCPSSSCAPASTASSSSWPVSSKASPGWLAAATSPSPTTFSASFSLRRSSWPARSSSGLGSTRPRPAISASASMLAAPAPPPPPPVVDVAAGENHSVVRTSGGAVYTWGLNLGDRAAQGRGTQAVPVPTEVPILSGKARAITAGAAHTLVVV